MAGSVLKFAPFSSAVDTGFWWKLSQKKLEVYKLDDTPVSIHGFYSNGDPPKFPGRLNVDYTAFDDPWKAFPRSLPCLGTLHIKNTIEDFKECDKKALLDNAAEIIWSAIVSGNAINRPSLLNRFLLLTYVDMKKYCFHYWFAFPALCYPLSTLQIGPSQRLDQYFNLLQIENFITCYEKYSKSPEDMGYFAITINDDAIELHALHEFNSLRSKPGKILFGFCDPCTLENHPGWPLRNLLALIAYHWPDVVQDVEVLCFRERFKDGVREISHSIVIHLHADASTLPEDVPGSVGWEKNEKQKKSSRKVDLSASMDPHKIAETSIDLNLKLMRWRLVPSLNLESIRETRCLLVGSGTLGCNVARCLMGWGIRNITLIDNGTVSYSNPVRQSLFNFEDCIEGGRHKAEAAACSLKRIFPEVNSAGIYMSIPMPGHYVTESAIEDVKKDVTALEHLVDDHDVVFLLTDTRESRWLPTVIASVKHKLVINAALGFDTYLVMRHGMKSSSSADAIVNATVSSQWLPGSELGCYFCNDVVAPGDSTQNRTMDQQCTVTRPGVSMIAAALAVELLVSILQHPDGGLAPADAKYRQEEFSGDTATALGIIPHQIRGFLSRFYQILPVCKSFDKCTACSPLILDEYRKEGFAFLLNAFNQPSFLEDLTGLTQLHVDTPEVWELSDDELSTDS